MKPHFLQLGALRLLSLTLACAALLSACGGGAGAGDAGGGIGSCGTGVTPPATGLAAGTVGGFGSIFVGGERCADTRAKLAWNTSTGTPETGTPDVSLGQSVEITFDSASATCKVLQALADPELVGVVSSLAPLTVAGQHVVLNVDASAAPPTVLDGYAESSAIKVGDRVEVHGKAVKSGGVAAVLASRTERKPGSDTRVRAKGVVSNLSATQFVIGGLTVKTNGSTRLAPSTLVLANSQTIVAWSTAAVAGNGSVTASVLSLARRTLAEQQAVRVEGPASAARPHLACRPPLTA